MTKLIILTATSLTLAFASPALASDGDYKCGATSGQWLGVDVIKSKAAAKGYDVRRIKREDNCYEVYAFDKNGARVEIYMNPTTGNVVKIKNKN